MEPPRPAACSPGAGDAVVVDSLGAQGASHDPAGRVTPWMSRTFQVVSFFTIVSS